MQQFTFEVDKKESQDLCAVCSDHTVSKIQIFAHPHVITLHQILQVLGSADNLYILHLSLIYQKFTTQTTKVP